MISTIIKTQFGKVHLYREKYKNPNDYIGITLRIGKNVYEIGYIHPSYGEYGYRLDAKFLGISHYFNACDSVNGAFDEIAQIIQYRYDDMARK